MFKINKTRKESTQKFNKIYKFKKMKKTNEKYLSHKIFIFTFLDIQNLTSLFLSKKISSKR